MITKVVRIKYPSFDIAEVHYSSGRVLHYYWQIMPNTVRRFIRSFRSVGSSDYNCIAIWEAKEPK